MEEWGKITQRIGFDLINLLKTPISSPELDLKTPFLGDNRLIFC